MRKKIIKKQAGDRFFFRENFYGEWNSARFEKLKSILSDRDKPYSKEEKAKLPQFGFGKVEGEISTRQLFPTHYVIIDLDTPSEFKPLPHEDEEYIKWSGFFKNVYTKVVNDQSIPYKVVYLTPSMCGLRFILELENQVADEDACIQKIKQFCSLIEKYGIKEEHIDIRINQPWYLPTFENYFNERDQVFSNEIVNIGKKVHIATKDSRPEIRDEVERLIRQIEKEDLDITLGYDNWLRIGFALTDEFGEEGRDYYHRISRIYEDYSIEECNKQYNSCLKSKREGIKISTLFWIAYQYGLKLKNEQLSYSVWDKHCFWIYDRRSKALKVDLALYYDFLEAEGFAKLYVGDKSAGNTPIYIQKQGYIVQQRTKENIIEYSYNYIKSLDLDAMIKKAIRNAFHHSGSKVNENNLATLSIAKIPFKRDTKDTGFLFFRNVFLEITATKIKLHPYKKLDGYIWASEILNRDFTLKSFKAVILGSNYYKFLVDVCTNGDEKADARRLRSLLSILGYIFHYYKDPANAKAIVLMDKDKTENAEGGTGKSLIMECFKHIRTGYVQEDGRRLKSDGRFEWAQVSRDSKIVAVDDLKANFKLEHLFSMITNDMIVEKKNQDKFTLSYSESPKFIFSTNYIIPGVGESYARRLIEFELSDYYHKRRSPRKKFGETFFDISWPEKQWQLFDNLMVFALQQYLKSGLKRPHAMNITYRKSVTETSAEFVEYINEKVKLGVEYNKHNLHQTFIRRYPDFERLRQNTFSRWLRSYASISGYVFTPRNSDGKKLFTYSKKRIIKNK